MQSRPWAIHKYYKMYHNLNIYFAYRSVVNQEICLHAWVHDLCLYSAKKLLACCIRSKKHTFGPSFDCLFCQPVIRPNFLIKLKPLIEMIEFVLNAIHRSIVTSYSY